MINKKIWKKALVKKNAKLKDVIRNLNNTGFQITLIVSSNDKLLGTVTDGDIRRGLLKGLDFNSPINSIININPVVAPQKIKKKDAIQLMKSNKIYHLPLVNKKHQVVDMIFLNESEIVTNLSNIFVIMAGGKGKRLYPLTKNFPKPLLKVRNKPILEHIIERAKLQGFQNFIISVNYLSHKIIKYFGDGSNWNVNIKYLKEKSPLGTAGALSLLKPKPNSCFLVTNGDVLTEINYSELINFHSLHKAKATMAVQVYESQQPYGVVKTDGIKLVGFQEKPISRSHINAGVYVFDPKILKYLQVNQNCDISDLFNQLQKHKERTIVYPIHESWLDLGRINDFKKAQKI